MKLASGRRRFAPTLKSLVSVAIRRSWRQRSACSTPPTHRAAELARIVVDLREAKGMQVGDHNTQSNTFS
jgi:hypothetical protein